MDRTLRDRRGDLERSWRAEVTDDGPAAPVRPEVLSSWRRSSMSLTPDVSAAPVVGADDIAGRWADSRLGRASRIILDDLSDLAGGGDMMAAITDETVTIAWIAGGRTMSRRADRVHFSLGGRWAEDAVGTNALALAQRTARPVSVFSAEHYAPMVHDWVCYSAPILDPATGRFLGVLDLSTVWHRAHPTLLTTVSALARCVEYELATSDGTPPSRSAPDAGSGSRRAGARSRPTGESRLSAVESVGDQTADGGITLRTLGSHAVLVDGVSVPVTHRQLELLTVLSLHPGGLSLDELTAHVYGDHTVSPSTVKAELSRLRHALGGRIGSRPYRLVGPVDADHGRVLEALAAGDLVTAVDHYRGPLLAFSESPDLAGWRNHLDVAIRDAVIGAGQPDLLWVLSGWCADDVEMQEAALAALAPADPRHSVAAGRLAAALTG